MIDKKYVLPPRVHLLILYYTRLEFGRISAIVSFLSEVHITQNCLKISFQKIYRCMILQTGL
jgi:hypothetical protein